MFISEFKGLKGVGTNQIPYVSFRRQCVFLFEGTEQSLPKQKPSYFDSSCNRIRLTVFLSYCTVPIFTTQVGGWGYFHDHVRTCMNTQAELTGCYVIMNTCISFGTETYEIRCVWQPCSHKPWHRQALCVDIHPWSKHLSEICVSLADWWCIITVASDERHGASNHQKLRCLFSSMFRLTRKKTLRLFYWLYEIKILAMGCFR